MNPRKPHSGNPGYVCELQAKLGGHIVVYDRERGFEIDAGQRWIVMHEPSSLHVAVHSQSVARDIMQGVARATTLHDAQKFADILPHRDSNALEVDNDGAVDAAPAALIDDLVESYWNAADLAEERAGLARTRRREPAESQEEPAMTAKLATLPHPNRSKTNIRAGSNPTPAQVRRAREDAGLTLEQAGALVYTSWRSWQNWEAEASSDEHRRMHPATWELFQVKLAAREALKKGKIAPADLRAIGLQLPDNDRST